MADLIIGGWLFAVSLGAFWCAWASSDALVPDGPVIRFLFWSGVALHVPALWFIYHGIRELTR